MRRRLQARSGGPGLALLFLLAACGSETAAPSDPTSSPVPSSAPAQAGALAFDDGSPGRLTATRAPDGTTMVSVEVDATGAPVVGVAVSAANGAADVTGLEIPMSASGSTWTGQVLLPLGGAWTFAISVARNDAGFLTQDLADASVTL